MTNTKSKDSTNASVASLSTADKKGNENKSDGSQAQIPEQPEDPSNERKLTLSSSPNESTESQTVNSLEGSKYEDEATLPNQSSINSEEHHSGKGEANSDSGSDGNEISAKENFIELNDLLYALRTAVEHPNDLAKHNEVRVIIKNSNLSKYYTRIPLQSLNGSLRM